MSIALYRTYRPAQLSEVIGQDHVVTALTRAIENDRIHHAYLFTGPRGCGKTSTARILARSLNCAQGPTTNPCGVCNSCVALAPNGVGNLDVEELDAASKIANITRLVTDVMLSAPSIVIGLFVYAIYVSKLNIFQDLREPLHYLCWQYLLL